jgi:hypothetical protein
MELENINTGVLPLQQNVDLSSGKEEEQILFKKAKTRRYEQDTELRNGLALMFTITINAWLFGVFLILLTNTKSLKLSDSIIITLLTTTTVEVLGMMCIILWDLFPRSNGKSKPYS